MECPHSEEGKERPASDTSRIVWVPGLLSTYEDFRSNVEVMTEVKSVKQKLNEESAKPVEKRHASDGMATNFMAQLVNSVHILLFTVNTILSSSFSRCLIFVRRLNRKGKRKKQITKKTSKKQEKTQKNKKIVKIKIRKPESHL